MRTPKGYKLHKVDFEDGEKPGWTFETPNGRHSDDAFRLRRDAAQAATEHRDGTVKHETVSPGGTDLE